MDSQERVDLSTSVRQSRAKNSAHIDQWVSGNRAQFALEEVLGEEWNWVRETISAAMGLPRTGRMEIGACIGGRVHTPTLKGSPARALRKSKELPPTALAPRRAPAAERSAPPPAPPARAASVGSANQRGSSAGWRKAFSPRGSNPVRTRSVRVSGPPSPVPVLRFPGPEHSERKGREHEATYPDPRAQRRAAEEQRPVSQPFGPRPYVRVWPAQRSTRPSAPANALSTSPT
ncbi:MAG: hypothetical protein JWN86_2762 [Planctomycetota bacterium]|nr:hypothetical protein [Planctomycetota bacterium]